MTISRSRIFRSGNSEAVRLPMDFAFDGESTAAGRRTVMVSIASSVCRCAAGAPHEP